MSDFWRVVILMSVFSAVLGSLLWLGLQFLAAAG